MARAAEPNVTDAMVTERHRQTAVVGRLLLSGFMAMRRGYSRKHIGAVFEELLVAMMIRDSDDRGEPPRTASDISRVLGLPRSNVRRCLDALIGEGVIRKVGDASFTGEQDYLAARVTAEYFARVREAIITAADELRGNELPEDCPDTIHTIGDEKGRARRPDRDD